MKLREVIIKNFRGYYNETRIHIDDLTALIGKNDAGKSSILDALDVFFNQSKVDPVDKNVLHTDEDTIIGCAFDNLPESITLEDVSTSFSEEYLLNENHNFEVWKKYPASGKASVWIYAMHPANDGFDDLLLKKNNDLKARIRALGLEEQANLTTNSDMRRVLWSSLGDELALSPKLISADQADEKKLWPKIEPMLPEYRLFKADRPSTDEDHEAQDPMQHAMKIALQEQADQLAQIAEIVQQKVSQVANATIAKLQDFDASLASVLKPTFKKDPMWEKAFSFSLTGENEIPLNKRGSGVRRLVLFSFFRATTESALFGDKNIIYAVEEPETSQHPDAQRMIVNTFREMTEKNDCQVIITTHVPGLAGMLPLSSLRYIKNVDGQPIVASDENDEELLKQIADTLGVYSDLTSALIPRHNVKLIVCVEGPNDVAFLTAISKIAHQSDASIVDLNDAQDIVILPLGGSILKEWVNLNYLKKLNTREYHIYDSDNTNAHARECERVNRRGDGSSARITRKREMENYIHSSIIRELFDVQIEITDTMDVSTEVSNLIRATNPEGFNANTVKKKINKLCAQRMTLDLLHERDPENEVLGWLREISDIVRE